MAGRSVRVAAVQMEHAAGDKEANLQKMRQLLNQACDQGAELVVFPECCVTGYWFLRRLSREALAGLAEPVPEGPAAARIQQWARELGVTVGAGLVEIDAQGRMFNSYLVAMPDGRWACHRKLHCFVSQHLESGDRFTVFDTPFGWRAAVLICYDNNLIENVRICALMGAQLLLAPHQTGGCRSGSPFAMGVIDRSLWDRRHEDPQAIEREFRGDKGRGWLMRWLPARAHDNGLFLVFANGVGPDDDEVRTGNAMVLDPYGRILAETSVARDAVVIADLDPALREQCTGVRWLRARRPELYGLLTRRIGIEQDTRTVRFNLDRPEGS